MEYKGVLITPEGGVYIGHFLSGSRTGRGREVLPDSSLYEGGFMHNKFEGIGKLTKANGDYQEGSWWNGKLNGPGVESVAGCIFTGEFNSGLKHGVGNMLKYHPVLNT